MRTPARHRMQKRKLLPVPAGCVPAHAANVAVWNHNSAESGEPCQVVVHTLFRTESFFSTVENGVRWADEVECLLDLHEARLESQALEFLTRLSPKP